MAMLPKIGQDAGLLALLLEALERPLKILVFVDDDFGQTRSLPGGQQSHAGLPGTNGGDNVELPSS